MKIWLDTIDCETIADGVKTGLISGVTTNPSILAQTSNVSDTLKKILDIQPGPLAVQVTSLDAERIIEEGQAIAQFSPRMVVKIPINHEGLIAMEQLKKEGVALLGTGVLFPAQALMATNLSYIAPYFSHMGDPFETLKTIVALVNESTTKVLVASLKHLNDIIYCALLGVYGVTIKPFLYAQLIENQQIVENFSQKFLSEWQTKHGTLSIKETLKL